MDTFSPVLRSSKRLADAPGQPNHQRSLRLREASALRSLNFRVPVTAVWYVLAA